MTPVPSSEGADSSGADGPAVAGELPGAGEPTGARDPTGAGVGNPAAGGESRVGFGEPVGAERPSADPRPAPPPDRSSRTVAHADIGAASAEAFEPATLADIDRRAAAFVDRVVAAATSAWSAAMIAGCVAEIDHLGADEIHGAATVTAAMLEPDARLGAAVAGSGGPAGRGLDTLRAVVATLDPADAALDRDPHGHDRYAARVERAERDAAASAALLSDARDGLALENAVLGQQERALWLQMTALRRLAHLAQRIDEMLATRIAEAAVASPDPARRLSVDVLLPVRHRRRDLLTQLAVAAQGYAAIRMIEATNGELIRTIDEALRTTATAVRAASLAVHIAANERRLGQAVTERGVRESMAAAVAALSAVDRSRGHRQETMRASLQTLHDAAREGEPLA